MFNEFFDARWHIYPTAEFGDIENVINTLNLLWQGGNAYVMDNHLAAAWCWLQSCDLSVSYNFLHIDEHSDLHLDTSDGVWGIYEKFLRDTKHDLDSFLSLSQRDSSFHVFRDNNYIRPINKLIPQWFKQSYFSYFTPFDIEEYDAKCRSKEYGGYIGSARRITCDEMLNLLKVISSGTENKWIIKLDIDYFFNRQIKRKGTQFIVEFSRLLNLCMHNTQVLTIALSPSYCKDNGTLKNGWNNSIRIFNQVKEFLPVLSNCSISV